MVLESIHAMHGTTLGVLFFPSVELFQLVSDNIYPMLDLAILESVSMWMCTHGVDLEDLGRQHVVTRIFGVGTIEQPGSIDLSR